MNEQALHWLSLTEVAARLRDGKLSPVDLTGHMLARIELNDDSLGSYTVVTDDRAFVAARQAEAEIRRGEYRGPLHGVPVAVKALCDVAGEHTSAGTAIFAERMARKNATVVRRLESAGAILLGLLTMTEGASAVHHPSITPPVNPWDHSAWSGASSSGSGVATAAGLCFAALGSDTAGSIRAPSHFCGVVGLKPTYGRVSRAGVFPLSATLDHIGPMARRAADCAAVLGAIAGPDPRDPSARQRSVPDYLAACAGSLHGLRIGWDETYVCEGVDPILSQAVRDAGQVLTDAGATLVPVALPDRTDALHAGATILHADVALAHAETFDRHREDYGPHLSEMITIGRELGALELAGAHEARRTWQGELEALFEHIDALLCPPTVAPAPPAHLTTSLSGDFRTQARFFGFTLPYTVSGSPCLTVPCGFTEGGLPLAFQLVGPHFEEARLLKMGHVYQEATGWHEKHPSG